MKHSNLIGIDVSDSSIKVLQLDDEKNIVAYGNGSLPDGVVNQGRIIDKEAFASVLRLILANTKPEPLLSVESLKAVLCLPESKLFTHYVSVPKEIKKAALEQYIKDDAERIIPFDLKDMYWDYHVAQKGEERNATFISVAKTDLDNYVEAFNHAGVRPVFVGGELFSLGKALLPDTVLEDDHIIIDMGAHTTTIGMFADDAVANASVVVPVGGDHLTQQVKDALGLTLVEAEKRKREVGVLDRKDPDEATEVLRKSIFEFILKLKEAKSFFEERTGNPVGHILLAGGSALLPGICELIQKETSIDTKLADPLLKIKNETLLGDGTPGILFANVVGLALYGTHADPSYVNLLTQYRYQQSDSEKERLAITDIRSFSDLHYVAFVWMKEFLQRAKAVNLFLKERLKISPALLLSFLFLACTLYFLGWVMLKYM